MIERYPELRYSRKPKGDDPLHTYLSDDYSFCQRWTDMGGEIWLDYKSRISLVGRIIYRGDIPGQADLPPD